MRKSVALNGDEKALVNLARQSRAEIAKVFSEDQNQIENKKGASWSAFLKISLNEN